MNVMIAISAVLCMGVGFAGGMVRAADAEGGAVAGVAISEVEIEGFVETYVLTYPLGFACGRIANIFPFSEDVNCVDVAGGLLLLCSRFESYQALTTWLEARASLAEVIREDEVGAFGQDVANMIGMNSVKMMFAYLTDEFFRKYEELVALEPYIHHSRVVAFKEQWQEYCAVHTGAYEPAVAADCFAALKLQLIAAHVLANGNTVNG